MSFISIPMNGQRRRLVDQAIEAYVEWREQCSAVWVAYSYWEGASRSDAARWHAAYLAALDREERASEQYGRVIRRVGALAGADLESMAGLAAPAARW
jgi:hypothetical protein